MPSQSSPAETQSLPRPVPETYWVSPGRLLVGAYPGSRSRADAMDRLRRFLGAGVTCFIDLTEADELPSYESLLPFATPSGRRIEYLRLPIVDHGLPASRDDMTAILRALDAALAAGHRVYLHCRAGIGRSALVAGCWLATQRGDAASALEELQVFWRQAAQSVEWPSIPETAAQAGFVRDWLRNDAPTTRASGARQATPTLDERIRGALRGLALGDALGAAHARAAGAAGPARLVWSQHTALTLCLAESLLEKGPGGRRDQVERYLRWQREGHRTADGAPGEASADVARALANYLWRGQAAAGSHDPREQQPSSLPRVLAAVLFEVGHPTKAVALAAQVSRTTHQSPVVLDACRYYAAMLLVALREGSSEHALGQYCEPEPGLWSVKPLKPELAEFARGAPQSRSSVVPNRAHDVLRALATLRSSVLGAPDFDAAVRRAIETGGEPALDGALAGTMFGALHGERALPGASLAQLRGLEQLDELAARLSRRLAG